MGNYMHKGVRLDANWGRCRPYILRFLFLNIKSFMSIGANGNGVKHSETDSAVAVPVADCSTAITNGPLQLKTDSLHVLLL